MRYLFPLLFALFLLSCNKQDKPIRAPQPHNDLFDLSDIQHSGEIIVLTLYGPDTYYDYRGKMLGYQFQVAELFGKHIGARVRVEVAQDENDLVNKLMDGEGDLIDCALPDSLQRLHAELVTFGDSLSHWSLRKGSPELAQAVDSWLAESAKQRLSLKRRETEIAQNGKRKSKLTPRAPIKNLAAGIISDYDNLFKHHAHTIGWDWRLLAAQAYQESAFDPQATSWAGAQGLIQLMPGTAQELKVANPYNPEENVRGAVKYLKMINNSFSDITNQEERIKFMLAAYNCGTLHVKDAQALAEKNGHNPKLWTGHVDQYVKALSDPRFYRDPVVKHGYCRGSEPYNYVIQIMERYREYRSRIRG